MAEHLRGADILVKMFERRGVRTLFTLSGNHIMSVFDALQDTTIQIIHTRHEAACVHMADAWARLTGQVGVAMVTGGPGHANAAAALFTAMAAESPVVLLSGHADLAELGLGAFQELDQAGMARPVTKASWTARSVMTLGFELSRALEIAQSGRPGPVHLSLPVDVLEDRVDSRCISWPIMGEGRELAPALTAAAADEVLSRLSAALRPVIVCGPAMCTERGRSAMHELEAKLMVPAVGIESPRGLNDPNLGKFAQCLARADLIVLLAKTLDFTLRFGRAPFVSEDCQLIVLDPNPDQIARVARSHAERLVYSALTDHASATKALLSGTAARIGRSSAWLDEVRAAISYRPPEWQQVRSGNGRVHPVDLCRAVDDFVRSYPDTILVCDGGEIGQWPQALVSAKRRIINGVAGTIGAALPFAIAAKAAAAQDPVIAVMGDGTFGFHMAELDTAVRYGLAIIVVIGNDARWNAEYQIQVRQYGQNRARGCELLPARYEQVATALGGYGKCVTRAEDLPGALFEAFSSGKPACLNVMIDGVPAPNISSL